MKFREFLSGRNMSRNGLRFLRFSSAPHAPEVRRLALHHILQVRAVGRADVEQTERDRRHLCECLLLDGIGDGRSRSLVRGPQEISVQLLDLFSLANQPNQPLSPWLRRIADVIGV
jgi:hypothetical protein